MQDTVSHHKNADGTITRAFYQIGLRANKTGTVYVPGINN